MDKSILIADNVKRLLLGCISKWQQNTFHVLLDNDYSIRVYQSFVAIFQNISYYAGIMLNAFIDLLCSKLCWHNQLVPTHNVSFGCGVKTDDQENFCLLNEEGTVALHMQTFVHT